MPHKDGITVLEVHCANLNLYHILVWHLGVLLLSAIGGLARGVSVEVIGQWRQCRNLNPRGLSFRSVRLFSLRPWIG